MVHGCPEIWLFLMTAIELGVNADTTLVSRDRNPNTTDSKTPKEIFGCFN